MQLRPRTNKCFEGWNLRCQPLSCWQVARQELPQWDFKAVCLVTGPSRIIAG